MAVRKEDWGLRSANVVSELARMSLTASSPGSVRNGIRLLLRSSSAFAATMEEVNALRDEVP